MMMKLAYRLGCYEALIKLGAKLTPEQLADYHRQVALREARLPDVHIPGAEMFQRPNTPAALRMNRQTQQLLQGLPLVGGHGEYYAGSQEAAQRAGAAREAELTRRLRERGQLYQRVPGAESFPATPQIAEGTAATVATTPSAMQRHVAKGTQAATPATLGTADTAIHIAPRKTAPRSLGLAKTVLRRFAHV